jgi:hypothetical protein
MKKLSIHTLVYLAFILLCPAATFTQNNNIPSANRGGTHHEVPDQPYLAPRADAKRTPPAHQLKSTGFFTVQVNVDTNGYNIVGDAANEPNITISPVDPNKMVIGWRQFDNVNSNFRQAGYGYSTDAGQSWTFPGVIDSLVFRSDPVLDCDAAGNFYYNSLTSVGTLFTCKVFKSTDGGATWDSGTDAHGGDKQWMTIDRTNGPGAGNIYSYWTQYYSSCSPGFFTRSTDGGASYEGCIWIDSNPQWGTMAVGPDGELLVAGRWNPDGVAVAKSSNAQIPGSTIMWDFATKADLDGYIISQVPINPLGILGQANVDVDCSEGPGRGNVYVLASVVRISTSDPADVMFARSTDGWLSWDPPVRINTDASNSNYQWFGTMSVAPNGRIDVVWLDTRDAPVGSYLSALYYCYSDDQGITWSINKRISELFDPKIGYPQQEKMGDYFDMVSDNAGAHLAWTNTLNGEQDVYYTHITPDIVGMKEDPGKASLSLTCYPNPFGEQTAIRYKLQAGCPVNLAICNIYGQVIRTLVDETQPAGDYTVSFHGGQLPAGFYFCRLTAGTQEETSRLIKLR